MKPFSEIEVRLRPAWHVSLPFLLGAFMLGIIAVAAQAALVLLFSGILVLWGCLWSVLAWRGRVRLTTAIRDAAVALPLPGADEAVRLGPANLKTRPKRPGILFWSRDGLHWQTADSAAVAARRQIIERTALAGGLEFPFQSLQTPRHDCRALSGDQLTLALENGESHRFTLPNPAVWSFVLRARAGTQ